MSFQQWEASVKEAAAEANEILENRFEDFGHLAAYVSDSSKFKKFSEGFPRISNSPGYWSSDYPRLLRCLKPLLDVLDKLKKRVAKDITLTRFQARDSLAAAQAVFTARLLQAYIKSFSHILMNRNITPSVDLKPLFRPIELLEACLLYCDYCGDSTSKESCGLSILRDAVREGRASPTGAEVYIGATESMFLSVVITASAGVVNAAYTFMNITQAYQPHIAQSFGIQDTIFVHKNQVQAMERIAKAITASDEGRAPDLTMDVWWTHFYFAGLSVYWNSLRLNDPPEVLCGTALKFKALQKILEIRIIHCPDTLLANFTMAHQKYLYGAALTCLLGAAYAGFSRNTAHFMRNFRDTVIYLADLESLKRWNSISKAFMGAASKEEDEVTRKWLLSCAIATSSVPCGFCILYRSRTGDNTVVLRPQVVEAITLFCEAMIPFLNEPVADLLLNDGLNTLMHFSADIGFAIAHAHYKDPIPSWVDEPALVRATHRAAELLAVLCASSKAPQKLMEDNFDTKEYTAAAYNMHGVVVVYSDVLLFNGQRLAEKAGMLQQGTFDLGTSLVEAAHALICSSTALNRAPRDMLLSSSDCSMQEVIGVGNERQCQGDIEGYVDRVLYGLLQAINVMMRLQQEYALTGRIGISDSELTSAMTQESHIDISTAALMLHVLGEDGIVSLPQQCRNVPEHLRTCVSIGYSLSSSLGSRFPYLTSAEADGLQTLVDGCETLLERYDEIYAALDGECYPKDWVCGVLEVLELMRSSIEHGGGHEKKAEALSSLNCAYFGCTSFRTPGSAKLKSKLCAGCKKVKYCSPNCQKKDWKVHKIACKLIGGGGGGGSSASAKPSKPSGPPPVTKTRDELLALPVKELKSILTSWNVSFAGLCEKIELVDRILEKCK